MVEVGRLRLEMANVSALLYSAGATLVLVGAVLDAWPGQARAVLFAVAFVAYVTAASLAVVARRRVVPLWVFEVLAVLGTLLVTVVVVAGGAEASSVYAILYVFVAAYVFYYFPPAMAVVQMFVVAVAYAVALRILDSPGAVAEWVVIVSAAAVSGGLIGGLGSRARELLDHEQEAAERLRELDAMKTTFLQAVSHELRTPLTNLQGYAVTLQRHGGELEPAKAAQMLDRLVHNADRLNRLLADLLEVDRLSRGIVENLLANAAKHTPSRTPLWVAVQPVEGGALLTVEDEGPGITDALKEKIFEPFAQGPSASSAPSPGTGIGLALVARFTELHGGRAWVEDRHDGGTRFNVFLPGEPSARADLRIR